MKSRPNKRRILATVAVAALAMGGTVAVESQVGAVASAAPGATVDALVSDGDTTTPIKHVVVIYDENVSFDHYFATYPYAANTDGTTFTAAANTPKTIDTELGSGLIPGSVLSSHNPTAGQPPSSVNYTAPNPNDYQPQRLGDAQAVTCDQNHSYGAEQSAENSGQMNQFASTGGTSATCTTGGEYSTAGEALAYYDGNTVTGLWNYAQHYAMSDNSWDAVFGPSTPGALNLISGNTYTGSNSAGTTSGTINSDLDPEGDTGNAYDVRGNLAAPMQGANVGDLLNRKNVTWGWFQGGFGNVASTTANISGVASADYQSHHEPFQYYLSTANSTHAAPAAGQDVGYTYAADGTPDPANHQYDLSVFNDIFSNTQINGSAPTLPAVSYLKAPSYQDGHAGYSDPLDEQEFLTTTINEIEQSSYWPSTAIVISYDDSDGWYDHVAPAITNSSALPSGSSGDYSICSTAYDNLVPETEQQSGRCGPSQRIPMLVISPYAKKNYVSHVLTSQVSVLKFVEQNWSTGGIDAISSVPGSFDASAASLDDFFDFAHPQPDETILDSQMYQDGDSPSTDLATNVTNLNPTFGAVVSTTTPDVTAPIAAPVIRAVSHTLLVPKGTAAPSTSAFLTDIGASITHGSIDVDLSAAGGITDLSQLDTSQVGVYDVVLHGSYEGVPAAALTIPVQVSPSVTLAHASVSVPIGSTITPLALRSLAGASISDGGTLDTPDLSSVDFGVDGTYQVQITGEARGAEAVPAVLQVVVGTGGTGSGAAAAPGTIRLATSQLWFGPSPNAPTWAQLAGAAGVSVGSGVTLDPVDLTGVDFDTVGDYPVRISGEDPNATVSPVLLTIHVIANPRLSVLTRTVSVTAGSKLSSSQVLADAFTTISSGTVNAVDLAHVNFGRPGSYRVTITGADHGVPAVPVQVTVVVKARPTKTTLTVSKKTVTAAKNGRASVRVVVSFSPKAAVKVALYDGAKKLKTVTTAKTGRATATLTGLKVGTHRLHATFAASGIYGRSVSRTVRVTVKRHPRAAKRRG